MRRSLALLVTSGLLPIVALSGAFGYVTLRAQRTTMRSALEATADFSATLASTKLVDAQRQVSMIAESPALDGALDRERFVILAERLRQLQPAWRILSIADPSGRRLLDVPTPIGGIQGGKVVDPVSLARVVRTQRPAIGDVLVGPHGHRAFAIRAPIVRDGDVRYIVTAVVIADALRPLLRFRPLPPGWRTTVIDGAGNVVASTDILSNAVARRLATMALRARRSGHPTFAEFRRLDGTNSVSTWAPIAGTNWSTHVSAPTSAYAAATSGALVLLISVIVACLALLALLIWLLIAELHQKRALAAAETQRQRMEALGQLTGGVAHDFNNLLTPILGGLDLIRPRVSHDERASRYVDAAIASAERARSLIARLLAFSRRQALNLSTVDVRELFESLRELLERSVAPTARVELAVPAEPLFVKADRAHLEVAVLNLVINARDAIPGGGTVRVAAVPVEVEAAPDLVPGAYVCIEVSDSGVGMDPETLRKAIDPFFTTKPADKGTGLGLSMVHGFAAQSGGALRLESTPGVGTVATIVMPVAAQPAAPAILPTPASPGPTGNILLVDDDERARSPAAAAMAEAGYRVMEADSVSGALAQLTEGHRFDMIVTDYFMPNATGADLIRAVRETDPGMPILLITGFADGANDIPDDVPKLAKPFRTAELLARLQALRCSGTAAFHDSRKGAISAPGNAAE